jgi:uncharacterized protein (TIGR03437 family)
MAIATPRQALLLALLACSALLTAQTNSTPPHLYVADTYNNRILCFKDARNVGTSAGALLTQKADLVIGQTDLLHSTINYPNGSAGQPSAVGLYQPVGLAVDSNGNLWVADSGNGRAIRFPAPFAQAAGSMPTASLVLGQPSLNTFTRNVTSVFMTQPYGLAIFSDNGPAGSGSLAVSDATANRILVFTRPTGGDFTNGQAAAFVVGQSSFTQSGAGNGSSQLNSPRGLAVDSGDRLFVCDSSNDRLVVFSKPTLSGPSATLEVNGLSQPQGVIVSFITGRSWVTGFNTGVYQLPEFDTLNLNPILQAATQEISSYGPVAVTLDPFDNLIVADAANRITFYFGQLFYQNTASLATGTNSTAGATPGMLVQIFRLGSPFSLTPSYSGSAVSLAPPWPTTPVNNIQVTVAGIPAPIYRIDPGMISFEIPNEAPQSGPANFVVTNQSTGQILAVGAFNMQSASPGMYTTNGSGTGQVLASVFDSKGDYLGINSPSVPTSVGLEISLWLTGAGFVPNLPADGTAPNGIYSTHATPSVLIQATPAQVTFSGINPDYPGLWQLNVIVPAGTPPSTSSPVYVVVSLDDHNSNIGGALVSTNGTPPGSDQNLTVPSGLITTIYVK